MGLPTFEQLAELPVITSFVVGPEHLDENGHMNVSHYFISGGTAMWDRHRADLGIDARYIADRDRSTFTVEQHIRYLDECVLGDTIDVPTLIIGRSDKAIHSAALIVNRTKQRLACVVEAVDVHVDFTSRRPVSFPEDIAALLDAAVEGDRQDWEVPISGTVGVRG